MPSLTSRIRWKMYVRAAEEFTVLPLTPLCVCVSVCVDGGCSVRYKEPANVRDPEEGGDGEPSPNTKRTAGSAEEHQ